MTDPTIIEGTARDVTPGASSVALTPAPQPSAVQAWDGPSRDPLRELGLMDPKDFELEVRIIKAGTERMLALQAGLLRGPGVGADGQPKDGAPGIDWDTIPGTPKPSLLQPGAERLAMFHRLIPEHRQQLVISPPTQPGWPEELAVHTQTFLHSRSLEGPIVGHAVASCSTYEDRYLYRSSERTCPKCAQPTIIKGKPEYAPRQQGRSGPVLPGYEQGGWVCWKKKGGCDANFPDEDPKIVGQAVGKAFVNNPRALINTVTQISAKRGFVGAIRHTLGITDLFTQDVEEFLGATGGPDGDPGPATASPAAQNRATPPAQASAAPKDQPRGGTAATFSGPVVTEPEGMRSTASGKVMMFAIKAGSSKHWIELWGDDKAALIPHLTEGVRVSVEGTRHEEDYPNRGDKPKKKVIRDVTAMSIEGGPSFDTTPATVGVFTAPVGDETTNANDGPPLFDDDDLAPPGQQAVEPVQLTGDPSGTLDAEGVLRSISWEQSQSTRFLYLEVVVDGHNPPAFVKVAVQEAAALLTIAAEDGTFSVAPGRRVRVVGGWNGKGTVVISELVVPL